MDASLQSIIDLIRLLPRSLGHDLKIIPILSQSVYKKIN